MLGFYSFFSHGWKLKKLFDIVLFLYNSAQFVIVKWLNVDLTVHKFCNSKQMLKIIHICMNFFIQHYECYAPLADKIKGSV